MALKSKISRVSRKELMGALVGVPGLTIYNRESIKSRPCASQLASIAKVRKTGNRETTAALESADGLR